MKPPSVFSSKDSPSAAKREAARRRPPERGFLATALVVIGILWLFATLAADVVNQKTGSFDETALRFFRLADDPATPVGPRWLRGAMLDCSALGSGAVLTLLVLFSTILLSLLRRRGEAVLLLVSSLGGALLGNALKAVFQRARPDVVPHLAEVMTTSFPSGHSMHSSVIYLTLGALMARAAPDRRVKILILCAALFLPLLIGVTRVYLGVHYPTDVLAGWCAGLLWALLCWHAARWLQRRALVRRETTSANIPPPPANERDS